MTAPLVVAIDPGSQHTGIVARSRDQLLAWEVIDRNAGEPIDEYAHRLLDHTVATSNRGFVALDHHDGQDVDPLLHAVEHFHAPTGQIGAIHTTPIAETAWLTGWLYAALRGDSIEGPAGFTVLLVPPAHHGRQPLGTYPDELVTKGERRGNWKLRPARRSAPVSHARSAFDVAAAAAQQHRTRPRRTA